MKKIKRILAGITGFAIILSLLAFYDAANGDPISAANARHQAVAYAEKLYPGQHFTVQSILYDAPFVYRTEVKSVESIDTHFFVLTKHWTNTTDQFSANELPEHERLVDSGWNTCYRMGTEAADLAAFILQTEAPELTLLPVYGVNESTVEIDLCFSEEDNSNHGHSTQYLEYLPLDQSFSLDILENVPARFTAQVLWPETPTEEALQDVMKKIRSVMEANKMPMAYYNITLIPAETTEHDEIIANMVESGNVPDEDISW